MTDVDNHDYQSLQGEDLKTKLRSLSRSELDEQLHRFGGQYAHLCQRLEAIYSPDRLDRFIAIRPGGLEEIDRVIQLTAQDRPQELSLLRSFRELNRILLPFMDVYEEHVLADLKYMSKEELETLEASASEQINSTAKQLKEKPADYRLEQNSSGTLRLMTLMKEGARHELKERFGFEFEVES